MRAPSLSEDQRLWLACAFAALLHLALLFGLRIGVEPAVPQSLEVSFVTLADGSSALAAKVLAPVTHAGGGHRREPRATPPRATGLFEQRGNVRAADVGHSDSVARTGTAPSLIGSSASATTVADSQDAQAGGSTGMRIPREEAPGIGPRNSDRNESALLSSDLMPGRTSGIRTRAHREALYRDAWRRQVERVGASNFPWSALTLGKPQSLMLSVTVRADGSVSRVRVLRSSGQPMLDKAAMEILRLAAPFPPFPGELRASVAELNFAYDWEFLPGDRSELRVGGPG